MDVTHKWPDWISDPLSMGSPEARCQIAPSKPMRGSCESGSGLENLARDDAGFPCKAPSPTRSMPRFLRGGDSVIIDN